MDDPRETRKLAANWREYLGESKESIRVYRWAWREFVTAASRGWMKKGVLALLGLSMLVMTEPWIVKTVIDGIASRERGTVALALGALLVVMAAARLCQWRFDHCREIALGEDQGRLDVRASELFFGKSLGQHIQDTGLLNSANVEKGRNRVLEVEHMLVFEGVPVLIELGLAFACLWAVSLVGGAVMTGLFCVYVLFMVFVNRRVLVECTPIDAELRRFNRHRVERWDNIDRVKTSGKEDEEAGFMTRWFSEIIQKDRRFWLWAIKVNSMRGMTSVIAKAGVMAYGAWLVWHGDWTVGLLYPFFQWSDVITRNLWRIGHIEHRLNWSMPSVRSLMLALTMKPEVEDVPGAAELPADRPVRVEFDGIGHAYASKKSDGVPEKRLHVLTNVSFSVEPGEKVALIGSSGAGKTTVMRLLQRYMDPEQGSIRIGDRDLREVRLNSWKRLIGYVPQQAQVLDGTLRYNLLYGLPEAERGAVSDETLWNLMRQLQIDFGERLTDGLDTIVGRRGIKLSGGQAQRLMIGAAVIKRPRFMLIDEATSSLDSTTEKAVQEGLARLLPSDTSALIITHRLSTVRTLCTKFVVLKPAEEADGFGRQVEAIAHSFEDLERVSPTFRRLAADQGVVIRESSSRAAFA